MSEIAFQAPDGPADEAKVTMVDALAEDVKTVDAPPEYPAGAPKLYLLLRSPYDRRAAAMRAYGEWQKYVKAHPELQKAAEDNAEAAAEGQEPEVDWDAAADSYEMVVIMDRVLRLLAHDDDEYTTWPDRFDVDVFMSTWQAWQAGAQPGEASSSSG